MASRQEALQPVSRGTWQLSACAALTASVACWCTSCCIKAGKAFPFVLRQPGRCCSLESGITPLTGNHTVHVVLFKPNPHMCWLVIAPAGDRQDFDPADCDCQPAGPAAEGPVPHELLPEALPCSQPLPAAAADTSCGEPQCQWCGSDRAASCCCWGCCKHWTCRPTACSNTASITHGAGGWGSSSSGIKWWHSSRLSSSSSSRCRSCAAYPWCQCCSTAASAAPAAEPRPWSPAGQPFQLAR